MYSGKAIKKGMIVLAWGSISLVTIYLLFPHRQAINYPLAWAVVAAVVTFGFVLLALPERAFTVEKTPYSRAIPTFAFISLIVYATGGLESPLFVLYILVLAISGILHTLWNNVVDATLMSLMYLGVIYLHGDAASPYLLGTLLLNISILYMMALLSYFLAERVKQSRAEAVRRAEELSILHEIGSALSTTLDLKRLLDLALERVEALVPFRYGLSIALFDPEKTKLTIAASRGLDAAAAAKYELRLADLVGVNRQIAVSAYVFGDGFSNMAYPTNAALLITLSLTVVPFHKWLKWLLSLWFWIILATVAFLAVAVAINYGPF